MKFLPMHLGSSSVAGAIPMPASLKADPYPKAIQVVNDKAPWDLFNLINASAGRR